MIYFISRNNQKEGPYRYDELRTLKLTDDVLVWRDGLSNWVNIKEVIELQDIIIKSPPKLPSEIKKEKQTSAINETIKYSKQIIIENGVLAFFLALILNIILTEYVKTGGTSEHAIFLTKEERDNQSVLFRGLFPYSIFISLCFLVLRSSIQIFNYYSNCLKKSNVNTINIKKPQIPIVEKELKTFGSKFPISNFGFRVVYEDNESIRPTKKIFIQFMNDMSGIIYYNPSKQTYYFHHPDKGQIEEKEIEDCAYKLFVNIL